MAWLLDTNILSEGRKPRPEPRVTAFYETQPLNQLYISVVNIAEIRFGIELQQDPARRAELNDWLALTLRPTFAGRILPVTEDILLKWRLLPAPGSPFALGFTPGPGYYALLAVGDFNGDGKADLAVSGGTQATILLGNGSGGFTPGSQQIGTASDENARYLLGVGDFNGDGYSDLAITSMNTNTYAYALNIFLGSRLRARFAQCHLVFAKAALCTNCGADPLVRGRPPGRPDA